MWLFDSSHYALLLWENTAWFFFCNCYFRLFVTLCGVCRTTSWGLLWRRIKTSRLMVSLLMIAYLSLSKFCLFCSSECSNSLPLSLSVSLSLSLSPPPSFPISFSLFSRGGTCSWWFNAESNSPPQLYLPHCGHVWSQGKPTHSSSRYSISTLALSAEWPGKIKTFSIPYTYLKNFKEG